MLALGVRSRYAFFITFSFPLWSCNYQIHELMNRRCFHSLVPICVTVATCWSLTGLLFYHQGGVWSAIKNHLPTTTHLQYPKWECRKCMMDGSIYQAYPVDCTNWSPHSQSFSSHGRECLQWGALNALLLAREWERNFCTSYSSLNKILLCTWVIKRILCSYSLFTYSQA